MKVIQVRGSFRKVGQSVGEATRGDISFMRHEMVPELLRESFKGDELRMLRDGRKHLHGLGLLCPEIADYVHGLAEGAGLRLDEILPIVFMEEMSTPLCRDKCSTLLVRNKDGWLLGHQEDYREMFYGRLSVLDLTFNECPRLVSLTYPGTFPGMATSLNSAGIAMACNALLPDPVSGSGKQAKHFLATLDDSLLGALSWICNGPHTLSDHFTVVSRFEDVALSIEVTSRPEAPESEEIREIVWNREVDEGATVSAPFTHANHVKLLEPWISGKEKDPAHPGSAMRQRKLDHIASDSPPATAKEMLALFRKKDGILNRDMTFNRTGQSNSVTIATTVISPNTGEIWFVEYGCDDEEPKYFLL